jgi:5-methylcytosine-specific restriction endonuclease McrA
MRWELKSVSDQKLLADLSTLVKEQRRRDAELIAHIAEVDRRRLALDLGYSSMFAYCTAKLHLSDSAAYRRITVGRLALRFPCVLDAIADGRVHVSGVSVLAPIVNADNVERMLDAAKHKNKREIERLVAAEAPKPDVPTVVRKVATVTVSPPSELVPERVDTRASAPAVPTRPAAQPMPALFAPLAPDRYSIKVTVSQATHDKLRRAQALLRHAVPSGDVAEVLDRALDALIEKVDKRKHRTTDKPRKAKASENARHIPNAVKREVLRRDQNRCAFVAPDGTRCTCTSWLEFDHVVPIARGGRSTVENLRLLCRAHNQHAARRLFGDRCSESGAAYGRRRRITIAASAMITGMAAEGAEPLVQPHPDEPSSAGFPAPGASGKPASRIVAAQSSTISTRVSFASSLPAMSTARTTYSPFGPQNIPLHSPSISLPEQPSTRYAAVASGNRRSPVSAA